MLIFKEISRVMSVKNLIDRCNSCDLFSVCTDNPSIYNSCIVRKYVEQVPSVRIHGDRFDVLAATSGCEGCYFNNLPFTGKCPVEAVLLCDDDHILKLSDTY